MQRMIAGSARSFVRQRAPQRCYLHEGARIRSLRQLITSADDLGVITVRTQEEMEALGGRLASNRRAGDVIFLRGDLGCGKTCFARGFIRAMTGDQHIHVTSPTYLLMNTYDEGTTTTPEETASSPVIHHVDLYRLDSVSDTDATALGLTEAFSKGISLVEWPQRLLPASIPEERLEVDIAYSDHDESIRLVRFIPFGDKWKWLNL